MTFDEYWKDRQEASWNRTDRPMPVNYCRAFRKDAQSAWDAAMAQALPALTAADEFMDNHGEVVFAGGGWNSVERMNSAHALVCEALREAEQ